MAKQATLVASLTTPPSEDGDELRQLPETVGYLEVRADLVGDLDPDWLRDRFAGGLIYTLRSRAEGGEAETSKGGRRKHLAAAAEGFDLVDLEADRDFGHQLMRAVAAERRLLSWHGPIKSLGSLKRRCEQMTVTAARFYKLIPTARQDGDSLHPLTLLHSLGRDDVIAFASGEAGVWTRLVAPYLGSPLIYGSFGDVPAAPGQLSIDRLIDDFGFPELPPVQGLYGIVGRPVSHSLSPRLHNAAYRELGFAGLYVPFHAQSFGDFWIDIIESGNLELFGLPPRGLSVTAPYKEAALAVSGASSPRAEHIGGANTLVWNEEVWEAETTDPDGVTHALEAAGVEIRGAAAAVVGCGGAGRAAAYGLQLRGAEVMLVNRHEGRGRKAAQELGLPFTTLADFVPDPYRVLVNATALGHRPDDDQPFDVERLDREAAVVDMVYAAGETPLAAAARARGCTVVDGRTVLLHQAFRQFHLMTGHQLDKELGTRLLSLGVAGR
ncbi:MAG: type I 3-dehydroquinate dehydratase [Thermoanaerobaculia bacterium]